MINFEVRYDEHLAKWQYRATGTEAWSEPHRSLKLAAALRGEVMTPDEKSRQERWSKPIDHSVRRTRTQAERDAERLALYEIKGGKVKRIAANAKEETNNQANEILAMLEGIEP